MIFLKILNVESRFVPFSALAPFLLIAFGLAWGIFVLFALFPERIVALFGELSGNHPLFILAIYAPAIAAFFVVLRYAGPGGFRRYLGRLLLVRCPAWGWLFLLFGIPLTYFTASALRGELSMWSFPFDSLGSLLPALLLTLIKGPVEELGWRGLALPLLQRKFSPLWAGLILGVIWGVWHLPAFLLSGLPQSAWAFAPFFIGSVAVSVILTSIFNASGGSILLAALFHFQLNNPIWPDAQPYDMYLFALCALAVVWFDRKTMLSREGGVAEVVPGEEI